MDLDYVVYSCGAPPACPPPYGPKFSYFHAVFGKIWQICMFAPRPGGLAPPPTGNPGSATADPSACLVNNRHLIQYMPVTGGGGKS